MMNTRDMGAPIKHSKKGKNQSVKDAHNVLGLKRTRKHKDMYGEEYETNKAARKRIWKNIRNFYK